MAKYGINDGVVRWVGNWLSGRRQRVVILRGSCVWLEVGVEWYVFLRGQCWEQCYSLCLSTVLMRVSAAPCLTLERQQQSFQLFHRFKCSWHPNQFFFTFPNFWTCTLQKNCCRGHLFSKYLPNYVPRRTASSSHFDCSSWQQSFWLFCVVHEWYREKVAFCSTCDVGSVSYNVLTVYVIWNNHCWDHDFDVVNLYDLVHQGQMTFCISYSSNEPFFILFSFK